MAQGGGPQPQHRRPCRRQGICRAAITPHTPPPHLTYRSNRNANDSARAGRQGTGIWMARPPDFHLIVSTSGLAFSTAEWINSMGLGVQTEGRGGG